MGIIHKLTIATVGIAMSLVTIQAKPTQAASLNLEPALTATGVDTARNLFGVNGSGIKIGVISDSFNTSTSFDAFGQQDTYQTDIANGYLPTGIQVLQDEAGTDEGRAMLELIHAIAPGASLAFAPDNNSLVGFANSVQALAADGANIIVDDIGFSGEPNPPDGPINQAIASVFNQGVSFFSAAGNDYPNLPIYGHPNSPDAIAVGAVYYGNDAISPYDGFTPQGQLEYYSSAGDPTLPLLKPDIVAPDGLDISFNLAEGSPQDQTTGFYSFFGTSAAAPFSAAIAALVLQSDPNATPSEIYDALRQTAQPLNPAQPGFNFDSGYGLFQADKAIEFVKASETTPVPEPDSVPGLLLLGLIVPFGLLNSRFWIGKISPTK